MLGWYIFYALVSVVLGYTNIFGDDNRHFYLLTGWLCIFLFLEIKQLYDKRWQYFLINPIVISCIITFGMSLGAITNFLQMKDGMFYTLEVGGRVLPHERQWLKITMSQVCLGALFTWLGYKGRNGINLAHLYFNRLKMRNFFTTDVANGCLIALVFFAYLIKLYLFSVGLHGRVVDSKYFAPVSGYKLGSQLRILGDLSLVTFIFVTHFFFKNNTVRNTVLFAICFALELFFAFIYGARGPFLTPFLIIFVVSYYTTRKVAVLNFMFIPIALYMAFTIVLEFKTYVLSNSFKRDPNPIQTIENFIKYREILPEIIRTDIYDNTGQNIRSSLNAVANAAMAIRHKDVVGLDDTDPNFVLSIVRAPFDAIVPKFLQSQNEYSWGYWFKNKVLHHAIQLKYSISITPVGFLYLSGGTIAVCLGFFIYGILLRFCYAFLNYGILGFIMFMALLSLLYNFDSVFSGTLVSVIRYALLYPIAFWFVFSQHRRRT